MKFMNLNDYKPFSHQYQEFLDSNAGPFIVLNFSGHEVPQNLYPDNYKIINFFVDVERWAEDLDIKLTKFIQQTLEENNLREGYGKAILIQSNYEPIKLLIYHIIIELWGGTYPITSSTILDYEQKKKIPVYFVPYGIKTRIRKLRKNISEKGVVIS
jgi:hypothetical protein